jgi:hypothetical protein
MTPRHLEDAFRKAAEALRELAETVCDHNDHDDRGEGSDRRDCFSSSHELQRVGRALLEAVEVVREAVAANCSGPESDGSVARDTSCQASPVAPMPPYPPYPPYAPYAPFPPYPPYPPVVVIGSGGCACSCHQVSPAAAAAAPSPALQVPQAAPIPPPPPPAPVQNTGGPLYMLVTNVSASQPLQSGFPDPAGLQNVEALLDVGESAAALVRRTLSHSSGGPGS